MSNDNVIKREGTVIEVNRDVFIVEIENSLKVTCRVSGKIRKNNIRILDGDKVEIEISPYDLTKGRIMYRLS
jgi:translation initiation factor IF-1